MKNIILPVNLFIWQPCKQGYKNYYFFFFFFINGIQVLLSLSRELLNHVIFITDASAIWFKTHVILFFFSFFYGIQALLSLSREHLNHVILLQMPVQFDLKIKTHVIMLILRKVRNTVSESFGLIIEQNISVWSHQKKSVWVYVPNHFEITVAYKFYIYIYNCNFFYNFLGKFYTSF